MGTNGSTPENAYLAKELSQSDLESLVDKIKENGFSVKMGRFIYVDNQANNANGKTSFVPVAYISGGLFDNPKFNETVYKEGDYDILLNYPNDDLWNEYNTKLEDIYSAFQASLVPLPSSTE